jgi:imidazolonepropionase-like amidohydrolase
MVKLGFLALLVFVWIPRGVKLQAQDTISINNVSVIPMTEEVVLSNQRVILANGTILMIAPSGTPLPFKVQHSIDGTGRYLIPGLSEMHYHWRSNDIESDFKLLIANGITTVRNMAEFEEQDHLEIRRKTQSGALMGLNYFTTGPYLTTKDIPTEIAVGEMVKMHKEKGYNFLKIAGNLPKDIYLELLEQARIYGVPVVGHAQRQMPPEFSLRMRSIEHIEEFLYLPGEKDGTTLFNYGIPDLEGIVSQLRSADIYVGTTLAVFDFINACMDDRAFQALQKHDLVKYLASKERESFLTEKNDFRKLRNLEFDGVKAPVLFEQYFSWMKSFTRLLSDNGIRLITGSDTYGMVIVGFSLHSEFEFLQETGIKPYDILLASTVNPARYLQTYASEGTITEGKHANLILLNKNPLEDIRNTRSIEGVFLNGIWFNRARLDEMLGEVEDAYK